MPARIALITGASGGIGSAIAVVIYLMTFGISLCSILFTKSKEVEL